MAWLVDDFRFDVMALRVLQSIGDRLAANRIRLLENERMQWPGPALDHRFEDCFAVCRMFFGNTLQRCRQVTRRFGGAAQITNAISGLRQDLVGAIENFLEGIMSYFFPW